MATDYGSFVSRTLDPTSRNFDMMLVKKQAPYSTADHNFQVDIDSMKNWYQTHETKSGILYFTLAGNSEEILGTRNSTFALMGDQPFEMALQGFIAKVKEWIFEVRGSKANGSTTAFHNDWNFIALNAEPAVGLRYDVVFLEVWRMLVQTTSATGKPDLTHIWPFGNTQWGNAASYFADDMVDPLITKEASARVQIQYRFRIVDGVSRIDQPLTDALVLAQGGSGAPVAGYTFTQDADDAGLYRAGAGNLLSRTQLVTPDGYVYAIPLMLIARRNSQAFGIAANKNGSQYSIANILTQPSDRPDGLYYDEVTINDVVEDLRHGVTLRGLDYQQILDEEFLLALSGEHQFIGKADNWGAQDSRLFPQYDGICIPPGQIGIDDFAAPDDFRRIFSDGPRQQLTTESITEGVAKLVGVLRNYPGAIYPGPIPPAVGTSDVIKIEAPATPACTVGIFPDVAGFGEPLAFWRTSGLPVVLTNLGTETVVLNCRRFISSKDNINYDEHLESIKNGRLEQVNLSDIITVAGLGDLVIGCEMPFNSIDVVLSTNAARRNTVLSALTVEYLSGGVWLPVGFAVTDGTDAGGITFGQSGDIDIAGIPTNWVPEVFKNGPKLYYIRLTVSAFGIPVMLTSVAPQFKSVNWGGLNTNSAYAQIDTTDPAYAAGDEIDITFAVRYPHSNGMSYLPADMYKAWLNDFVNMHDLAFASENEVFHTALIQQTVASTQFYVEDYNVLDPTYAIDFGAIRLMRGYIQGNNTPTYILPASYAAAVWGPEVTAAATVLGYYDFEEEVAPNVWNPLTVAAPAGVVRAAGGATYTITFTGAVVAADKIRYRALMDVTGFVYNAQEKGIVETCKMERVTQVQAGAGAVFQYVASGRILSYETMYNPATGLNDPVVWTDPLGGAGAFSREVLVAATVTNGNLLNITMAAPPAVGTAIEVSVVIAAPILTTEAWQICYPTEAYQGHDGLPYAVAGTDFDVLAITQKPVLTTIGTGQATDLTQRDFRNENVVYRMPIGSVANSVTDGRLQSDCVRLPDSEESRIVETPRFEVGFDLPNNGTSLQNALLIQYVDDGGALNNCFRGQSDHSLHAVTSIAGAPVDYVLDFKLQKIQFGSDLGVLVNAGAMAIWAALCKDRATSELFLLLFTACVSKANQKVIFRAISSDSRIAFDFLRTRRRYLS